MNKKQLLRIGGAGVLVLGMLLMWLSARYPEQPLQRAPSYVLTDREGGRLYARLSPQGEWCLPVSVDQMGEWLKLLAVEVEDRRFYHHPGVDPLAMARALHQNIADGRRVSGASTISSQVVRLRGYSSRGYGIKAIEFARAMALELRYSKEEILELYLNNTPYGGNLWGVEAASCAYFNKSASELSLGESALLISLLRSPSRLRPDRYPQRAKESRNRLLRQLYDRAVISEEQLRAALLEPIPQKRYPFPKEWQQIGESPLVSEKQGRVQSSIHPTYQQLLLSGLQAKLSTFPQRVTGAGILVDNSTGEILAYVANARFGTSSPSAWVDCLNSPRSPGSTLKSFVYAEAFERGLLTPQSLLADTPLNFDGNSPRNFDLLYRGGLSARRALAESINVPAVRVLRQVGIAQTLNLYRRLGFKRFIRGSEYYRDSLVLGGCEVTALELASAYVALADFGEKKDLWLTESKQTEREKVFSPGSSFLTLDILKDEQRLVPLYREVFRGVPRDIAFKTGTSYGLRDAWTVACSPAHTLVIWLGDPFGAPFAELSGLKSAAPIAVKMLRDIYPASTPRFKRPQSVAVRTVCALSGAPLGEYCEKGVPDLYIKKISNTESCSLHVAGGRGENIVWPDDLASWGERHSAESRFAQQETPRILSPKEGASLLAPSREGVRVFLQSEGGRGELYWFLDSVLVATEKKGDRCFVDLPLGKHALTLTDEEGNASTVKFNVILPNQNNQTKEMLVLD